MATSYLDIGSQHLKKKVVKVHYFKFSLDAVIYDKYIYFYKI